jgi:hypothetical protein
MKSFTNPSRCYRRSKIKISSIARGNVFEEEIVLDALFIVPEFLLVPVASMTFSLLGSTGFSLNFVAEKKNTPINIKHVVFILNNIQVSSIFSIHSLSFQLRMNFHFCARKFLKNCENFIAANISRPKPVLQCLSFVEGSVAKSEQNYYRILN